MNNPNTTNAADKLGLAACWQRLPDKGLFFGLLAAWLALFHFLGNSTFGYVDTSSLFNWMFTAYNSKSPTADDGHANLIPFVVLGLFWWKRKELLGQPMQTWWPGLLLVAGALALHVVGYVVQQPRLCIMALFTGIYGLMGLAWGARWLRASFFPFFLLAFMVPLGSLTEPVTFPLRLLVSKAVAFVSQHLLAIDVGREGTKLFSVSGGYQYEVAAACSGIRSLMAITAISVIYAFMVFKSWNRRTLLIATAVPLAFLGNAFRMMVIVLAAQAGGQDWGNYVHEGGPFGVLSLLPYVPAIVILMVVGRWLEKAEAQSAPGVEGKAS
jgi:exosortase